MDPETRKQIMVSPKHDVKSTAVVKRLATPFPVQFSKLSTNTDLNDAPANWLRGESWEEQHLRDLPWQRQHSDCSSFVMAHCYPDYAGEVDVISDAENIKMLLKIPYSNSHTSLMVHRVGRTLLLDNFDIHKHLLRRESETWTWLCQFFKNTVMQGKNEDDLTKYVPRQVKTQSVLQKQLMFSKFLYKSLEAGSCQSSQEVEVAQVDRPGHVSPCPSPSPVVQQFVADRFPAIDTVQLGGDNEFHRQMLWTFEDLRMLIGTDLPVFSVGDHPCVSLRLRETSQPINVVTGLDYWLDNLMCNVPDVAMCYHDSGFVKKYELIKTEDIPKLTNCGFKPHEVKDIATNILSFLRNSATKEGHTYWLYKCNRSDLVKLYDLTTLCDTSVSNNNGVTPFTIPVAMLLYRVGRKLLTNESPRQVPKIRTLLETSLQLLDSTEHAEVCTSANYLLSDLHVPDGCLQNVWVDDPPEKASSESDSSEQNEEEEGEEACQSEFSVSVKDLMNAPKENLNAAKRIHLKGITGTPDERCKDGLSCLRQGLSSLERDLQSSRQSHRSSSSIVEEQQTCNSSEAIPLRYETIQKTDAGSSSSVMVKCCDLTMDSAPDTWHKLSKALILRKASMAHYVLARELLSNKQSGSALKHIRYAIHCFEAMASLKPGKKKDNQHLLILILLTMSEIRHNLAMSSSFEEHQRGYNDMTEEDAFILESAKNTISTPELEWAYTWTTSQIQNLRIALKSLDTIRELARQQSQTRAMQDLMTDVRKKTSGICNELGKAFMTQAETMMANGKTFQDIETVWNEGMSRFRQGEEGFIKAKDRKNEAIVKLNIIRLHKIAAQAHMNAMAEADRQFAGPAQYHFNEACGLYKEALKNLNDSQIQVRRNLLWDFSSTYLTMGLQLRYYPPGGKSNLPKVHQEVADLFHKAMKQCQKLLSEAGESMHCCCKDRLATLEFNLAELHSSSYTHQKTAGGCNRMLKQAESCYQHAVELFEEARKFYKILQAQCKRLELQNGHNDKYLKGEESRKSLSKMLKLIADCEGPLTALQMYGLPEDNDKILSESQDPKILLDNMLLQTQIVLKHLLKSATESGKPKPQQILLRDLYKHSLGLHSKLDSSQTEESKFKIFTALIATIKNSVFLEQ